MNRGKDDKIQQRFENAVLAKENTLKSRPILTPYIVTLCEGHLSVTDIEILLDIGIKIVRFKMGHVTRGQMIKMLDKINIAVDSYRSLHDASSWAMAISLDLPNACIRTGALKDEILENSIDIVPDTIIKLSSDPKNWNKCDSTLVYIDDPYTIKNVKLGTEVSIRFGLIVAFCIEVVDSNTLKCKVARGGKLRSLEFVCIRGVKHTKPALMSKNDLEIIEFAKEFEVDVLSINSLRKPATIKRIRGMFRGSYRPLIMSTICEQEGLDNIDEIIKLSDGIILAREFLACEIEDKYKMIPIQMSVAGKCRAKGKPFFISGNILEKTLHEGTIDEVDLVEITNGVLQGAGFILRSYNVIENGRKAIKHLESIAKTVESVQSRNIDFWRLIDEVPFPAIASQVSILACALLAKQTEAIAIIVPTVSGNTPVWVSQMAPDVAVLAVTTSNSVARKLQLYRGVIPIIYTNPKQGRWAAEMDARVRFAIDFGLERDILVYGSSYVALKKTRSTSSFADNVSSYVISYKHHDRSVC